MTALTHRLIRLAAKETRLPVRHIENHLIPLDRLPVCDIEYKLADYYQEAACVMTTYMDILRRIREIMRGGFSLDHPYAREALRKQEIRLQTFSRGVRLAQVDKLDHGLFILRFRTADPAASADTVLIFIDTHAGKTGSLAFIHQACGAGGA